MPISNVELAGRVRDALDTSVAALDSATLLRLQQARRAALAQLSSAGLHEPTGAPSRWISALSVAATFLIALGVWQQAAVIPGADPTAVVRLDAQEVDLMEDLDFVAWMVVEDGRG